jgi:hypothetical protein
VLPQGPWASRFNDGMSTAVRSYRNLPGLWVSPPTQCHRALQAMDFKNSDFLCACAVWRLITGLLNLDSEIVYDE